MRRMPWATYLWPGLPQVWSVGRPRALALAIAFGAALDLLLLASWVWVEWIGPKLLWLGWLAIAGVWAIAVLRAARAGKNLPPCDGPASCEGLFREAMGQYLQGSWFEAERILVDLLTRHPRDAEARLLLATLLRHNRRNAEALIQLNRLELLLDAQRWAPEIAAERRWIAQQQAEVQEAEVAEKNTEIVVPGASSLVEPPRSAEAA